MATTFMHYIICIINIHDKRQFLNEKIKTKMVQLSTEGNKVLGFQPVFTRLPAFISRFIST